MAKIPKEAVSMKLSIMSELWTSRQKKSDKHHSQDMQKVNRYHAKQLLRKAKRGQLS